MRFTSLGMPVDGGVLSQIVIECSLEIGWLINVFKTTCTV